jgi:hypothetical protein
LKTIHYCKLQNFCWLKNSALLQVRFLVIKKSGAKLRFFVWHKTGSPKKKPVNMDSSKNPLRLIWTLSSREYFTLFAFFVFCIFMQACFWMCIFSVGKFCSERLRFKFLGGRNRKNVK